MSISKALDYAESGVLEVAPEDLRNFVRAVEEAKLEEVDDALYSETSLTIREITGAS
jgi:hypothetical protein